MAVRGWHYDGATALRYEVEVEARHGLLHIRFGDGAETDVDPALLTIVESRAESDLLGRADLPGWRLGLVRPLEPEIEALLPARERYGRWIDRVGLLRAILIGLIVSGSILFLVTRIPAWAAPYVPMAWEDRMGDALVGDFGGKFCNGREGLAALDKLVRLLDPGRSDVNVRVVDIEMANAAALPGGNIVIFDALLKEAEGPDEAAGVIAHELAHIERRHVTEAMIRQLGFGTIIAAFGGTAGANIDAMLSARYGRAAERQADRDAIATLLRADVSPVRVSKFFARLARDEARLGRLAQGFAYLSSHPMSAERQKLFEQAGAGRSFRPTLSEAEWKALVGICG